MKEAELDALLAEARMAPREASPELMDRILTDALALQVREQSPDMPVRGGFWQRFVDAIGGRGPLAGLTTAAAVGLYLGFVAPAPVSALTETLLPAEVLDVVELLPAEDEGMDDG
ncbi:MAG: hypothetical protein ACK5M4_03690 [Pseudorhodobacter sp.]